LEVIVTLILQFENSPGPCQCQLKVIPLNVLKKELLKDGNIISDY